MKAIKLNMLLAIILVNTFTGVLAQNHALNFDGVDDFVAATGIPNPTGSFTAEAWAKMESYGMRTVLSKIQSGYLGFTISYDAPNNAMGADIGNGSSWPNVLSLLPWNLNQWYHVAMVYDATIDTMYYYQDGILQGSVYVVPAYSTTSFKIGNDDWYELWDGDIDEVRLWSIALTQTDIQNTMFMELTGTEPGLTNYYKFNQGIPGANNTGILNLLDSKGTSNGTFVSFALNGSTSNFVGSTVLGINTIVSNKLITYPNPASEQITIQLDNPSKSCTTLKVTNMLGECVIEDCISGVSVLTVNINHLKPGIYIVQLENEKVFSNAKFIKL